MADNVSPLRTRSADPDEVLTAVENELTLFHSADGTAYGTTTSDGGMTFALTSRAFADWLARFTYRAGLGPLGRAADDIVGALSASALYDAPLAEPSVRVAQHEDAIWVHMGGDDGRSIRITSTGWAVVDDAPIAFLRSAGQKSLPEPVSGGDISDLEAILGLTGDDLLLVAFFMIGAFDPEGPYPVLTLVGGPGSGKTTTAEVIRYLVDPVTTPTRSAPRNMQELMIAARHSRALSLDNLTSMPQWLTDGVCRITSGAGAGYRRNYTDDEEVVFAGRCPVVLNGIGAAIFSRSDLVDRSLVVRLPHISDQDRKTRRAIEETFREHGGRALGFLLDCVVQALANFAHVETSALPRLADFTKWCAAAAPVLGRTPDEVVGLITRRSGRGDDRTPTNTLTRALLELVLDGWGRWEGTATEMLAALEAVAPSESESLPDGPSALGRRLNRPEVVEELAYLGVTAELRSRTADERRWVVEWADDGLAMTA